jgi:hypothetical protein
MTDILDFLGVLALFLGLYTGLPSLYLLLRRALSAERLWIASLLFVSLQAILGTLWSRVLPASAPYQLLLAALALPIACELALRAKTQPFPRDPLLPAILLLAIAVRAIDPILHPALGQSDAYGHLQFLRDIVTRGQLRHAFYPPAHAWVSALPALLSRIDLYTLARHGGAVYGLGLVSGIYFLSRRISGSTTARHAALLAAGFPLIQPLLRTGIGLFANQLGLLLLPLILYTIPTSTGLLRRPTSALRFLLPFLALAIAVPMMSLDLCVVLALNALLSRFSPSRERTPLLPIFLGGTALVVLGIGLLFHLPADSLNATVGLITASEGPLQGPVDALLRLLTDYLRPKSSGLSLPLLIGSAIFALLQAGLCLWSLRHAPTLRPVFVLGSVSGFQSVTGILQFSSYQRAGWFFLIAACISGGWILGSLSKRLRYRREALFATALACLVSLWLYPRHQPHLSGHENALVQHLRDLRHARQLRRNPPPLTLWTRAFNNFPGAQGDPVPALLEDIPNLSLRRVLPEDDFHLPDSGTHLFLLDAEPSVLPANASSIEKHRAHFLSVIPRIRQHLDPTLQAQAQNGWFIIEWQPPQITTPAPGESFSPNKEGSVLQ